MTTKEVWENSEIIMKIRGPTENKRLGKHEAEAMDNT